MNPSSSPHDQLDPYSCMHMGAILLNPNKLFDKIVICFIIS